MKAVLTALTLLLMLCSHLALGKALPGQVSGSSDLGEDADSPGQVSGSSDLAEEIATSEQVSDSSDLKDKTASPGQVSGSSKAAQECLKQKGIEKILRELNKMTENIKASLPKDNNKHQRLLPKFTKSVKGVAVMKEILDFYSEDVFSRVSLKDQKTEHILDVLARLRRDMDHCLYTYPSSLSQNERYPIWKMKKTFHELRAAGVHKAVGEFKTVLNWVDTYIHQRTMKGHPGGGRL
ncbi:uncharacterized protein LOC108920885 [Scleropages formosus]|uniref:uncharacterized protein LOC108920885 n=1 Tax=Scleropages formosus TaxID=113540 RepID=UPI00087903A7|nr:interleukin-26 [Scleropages formosus]